MFVIDSSSGKPIYEQIYDNVEKYIVLNVLEPGDKLPSVRNLSAQMSINPNTVQKAYKQLENDGYIYSVKNKGSFVNTKNVTNEVYLKKLDLEMKELISRYLNTLHEKSDLFTRIKGLIEGCDCNVENK